MSTPNISHEALAIVYLSGQASAEEISKYKELFRRDETFRQTVRNVEMWLAPLNENTADMSPPEGLLETILEDLELAPRDTFSSIPQITDQPTITPSPYDNKAANDNTSRKWKAFAIAASLVAVAAIGSHFIDFNLNDVSETQSSPNLQVQQPIDQGQQFLALLSDDSQPELVAIIYNPATGRVVAKLSNIMVPEDGDLQLWLIREGEAAPKSLGVMERAGESQQVEFDVSMTLQSGTDVLAISLEQKGGSASAGPEGPILFTGAVATLKRDI